MKSFGLFYYAMVWVIKLPLRKKGDFSFSAHPEPVEGFPLY
jgi:hypothetical protein